MKLLNILSFLFFGSIFIGVLSHKVQENTFTFKSNGTVTIAINAVRHVITDGQTYSGTTAQGNKIIIKAGRDNSAAVAAAFSNGLSQFKMFATEKVIDFEPKELHFVIFGNITLTFGTGATALSYECEDWRLAQGHYGFTNNWWIGSTNCMNKVYTCSIGKKKAKIQFHTMSESDEIYVLPDTL